MGKILGIAIKNYGSLKDIKMGQLYSGQTGVPLGNMVAIIGPSGNGKSTLADAFGFIADALTTDVESACDASNRGGYDKLVSQGSNGPIHFEIYYKENSNSRPITYLFPTASKPLIYLRFLKPYNSTPTKLERPSTFIGGLLLCLCACGIVGIFITGNPITTLESKIE